MARILLIDDDGISRGMAAATLSRRGNQITEARTGEEGLARLALAPFDLVITDLVMPGQGGLDVLGAVRRSHPAMPVLLLSGWIGDPAADTVQAAEGLGVTRMLAKPYSTIDLIETVQGILDGEP